MWKPAARAEIILVFASTTEVLNVEDLLEDMDLPFELVPVPKEVNPNCGLAISFFKEDRRDIFSALKDGGFTPLASYLRRGGEFEILSGARPEPDPAEAGKPPPP